MELNKLDLSLPRVMTIINITPDSFYGESRVISSTNIESTVSDAIRDGAYIVDIGGYSSRPGADVVPVEEEIRRVLLGLEATRKVAPNMIVSIDTFRSEVADIAMKEYGNCIVNDISAGELDPKMVEVVAKYGVPYIAMHMRANPQTMQQHTDYANVVDDVVEYFRAKIFELKSKGVKDVIIDPGFGFAKSLEQNFELIAGLDRLCELEAEVLVGVSRKSMVYKCLDTTPEDALIGSSVLHWELLRKGAKILRVHDTKAASQVIKMYEQYEKIITK